MYTDMIYRDIFQIIVSPPIHISSFNISSFYIDHTGNRTGHRNPGSRESCFRHSTGQSFQYSIIRAFPTRRVKGIG